MNLHDRVRGEIAKYQNDPDYQFERLILEVNEQIVTMMEAGQVRRTDLASRLGVSKAYVTKLLNGPENVTLKTLVRVATALNARVELRISNRGAGDAHEDLMRMSDELGRITIEIQKKVRVKKKHHGAGIPATKTRNVSARSR